MNKVLVFERKNIFCHEKEKEKKRHGFSDILEKNHTRVL